MKILAKIVIMFLLFPLGIWAHEKQPEWKGRYTKQKTIKKAFNVNSNALLSVDNSYGNVVITTWNQNRTEIEVVIKTNGDDEDKVQRKLDEITVNFMATSGTVAAKTIFEKKGWSLFGGNDNVNMEINYTIKLPVTNSVNLSNDYGGIQIDKLNGDASISCDYGKLTLGRLNGNNNSLAFDYTTNATIEYIKNARINADYSDFELAEVGNLELSADYTKSKIGKANHIKYNCDYGSLNADAINNLEGTGDYITLRLGEISGNVQINAEYGSLKIAELTPSAGNVMIKTEYTGMNIGYNANYFFNFEIALEYGGLKGGDGFNYNIQRDKSGEKYYAGTYGNNPSKNVTIKSEYGSVHFTQK
ncbi:hypothetical protein ACG2LH_09240 [Zhouia sp. PK063]|uniref:hypothetical protein n=1 Tax=Zhouia sp. PK063 TaxID=3373602 RepID=UPI0037B98E36